MKKSLLKLYSENDEAREFISRHSIEFSPLTYEEDELAFFKPDFVTVEDISIIIKNTGLLKDKRHTQFMNDYFQCMSIENLTKKYGYKNKETTISSIKKFKNTILNKVQRIQDKEFAMEMKKVSNKYLNENRLKNIIVNHYERQYKLNLIRVTFKNKLEYKYLEEDRLTIANKFNIIKDFLSITELKKTRKMKDMTQLKPYQFQQLNEIVNRFRWVNNEGYFVTKAIDDSITDLLAFEEQTSHLKIFQ